MNIKKIGILVGGLLVLSNIGLLAFVVGTMNGFWDDKEEIVCGRETVLEDRDCRYINTFRDKLRDYPVATVTPELTAKARAAEPILIDIYRKFRWSAASDLAAKVSLDQQHKTLIMSVAEYDYEEMPLYRELPQKMQVELDGIDLIWLECPMTAVSPPLACGRRSGDKSRDHCLASSEIMGLPDEPKGFAQKLEALCVDELDQFTYAYRAKYMP